MSRVVQVKIIGFPDAEGQKLADTFRRSAGHVGGTISVVFEAAPAPPEKHERCTSCGSSDFCYCDENFK